LLLKSIEGAVTHPLLGVGPGLFTVYTGQEAEKEGQFYGWGAAHNTYTQIASEGGFPAFGLFLTALITSLRGVIRVRRATGLRADLADMHRDVHAFLTSLTGIAFFALFDSLHNLPLLFMLFGLAVSLARVAALDLQPPPQPAPLPGPPPTAAPWARLARAVPAPRPR
jgi:O-antigen ligase